MNADKLESFARDVAYISIFGYRFAARVQFDKYAPQAVREGIKDTPGAWGIYDPESDYGGWALVGDDPAEIVAETANDLEYSSGIDRVTYQGRAGQ